MKGERSHLISEGQIGEDRQVLGPLDRHEEETSRSLVHILRAAGRVQRHVVLRRRPLRLIACHINILINCGRYFSITIYCFIRSFPWLYVNKKVTQSNNLKYCNGMRVWVLHQKLVIMPSALPSLFNFLFPFALFLILRSMMRDLSLQTVGQTHHHLFVGCGVVVQDG